MQIRPMKLSFVFFIFFSHSLFAQSDWSLYLEKANEDAANCKEFLEVMTENKNESSTAMGYYALATMLQAKLYGNPFTKLSYFNKGKKILEASIQDHSENVELRFLRFAVQTEVPGILLYFDKIDEDKTMLDQYLNNQAEDGLTLRIKKYYRLKEFDVNG